MYLLRRMIGSCSCSFCWSENICRIKHLRQMLCWYYQQILPILKIINYFNNGEKPQHENLRQSRNVGSRRETCIQSYLPSLAGSRPGFCCTPSHIHPLLLLSCILSVCYHVQFEAMDDPTETNNRFYEQHFDEHTSKRGKNP